MKRTVTIEETICDECETDFAQNWCSCFICKKALCHKCAVTYHPYASHGYGDGYYCHDCDNKLRLRQLKDELWSLYQEAKELLQLDLDFRVAQRKRADDFAVKFTPAYDAFEVARKQAT